MLRAPSFPRRRQSRCFGVWIPALAGMTLSACSSPVPVLPGRIVSNNPCIDAVLAEVADPESIGAVSAYSHDPDNSSAPVAWARRYPAIGSSAEEVIVRQPSLVLTGNIASSGTNAALARAGIKVLAFGVPADLAANERQVAEIAHAIGSDARGKALVARMTQATVQSPMGPSAIIWTSGGFVAGKGTIQDEMLSRAGYWNASTQYGLKQWDILPLETLLRRPPDVIFMPVTAKGDDGRSLALRLRVLRHLGSRTRVVPFPERLLNCGGPSVIQAMKIFREAAPL